MGAIWALGTGGGESSPFPTGEKQPMGLLLWANRGFLLTAAVVACLLPVCPAVYIDKGNRYSKGTKASCEETVSHMPQTPRSQGAGGKQEPDTPNIILYNHHPTFRGKKNQNTDIRTGKDKSQKPASGIILNTWGLSCKDACQAEPPPNF